MTQGFPPAFPPVITTPDFTPVQPKPPVPMQAFSLVVDVQDVTPAQSKPLIQRTNHREGALHMNAITGSAAPVIDPMHHHALPVDVMVEEEEENMS